MEKELIKKIKYINRYKVRWIMMWLIQLIICAVICFSGKDDFTKTNYVAGFALCILFPFEYYRKYNNLLADRRYKDQKIVGEYFQNIKLSTILKCHSFSVEKYVKLLAVRLLPFQIITIVLNVFYFIIERDSMSDEMKYVDIGISLALIIFPLCISYIYYRYYQKELTTEGSIVLKKIRDVAVSFVNAVIEFVCSVLCILYFIIFLMFGLLENLVWLMVKDKTVLCISHNGNELFIVLLLIFFAFYYFMWDQGSYLISPRVVGKLRIIVGAVFAAVVIYYPVSSILNHIELGKDRIAIVRNGKAVEYAFDEITGYQIYPKDGSIKVDVDFSNGNHEALFMESTVSDDDWADGLGGDSATYDSDNEYGYTLYLARQLKELGINGEIKDIKKLRKISKEYEDSEIEKAFEEIEKLVKH